ncbi:MAG: SO2930 family diheme c-type cytochrome [Cyclobacteriaceae bacterium]|jgi:uncharacterized repeat protein (TIGR03806 family)
MNTFLKCSALILLMAACQQKKPEIIVAKEEVTLAPNLSALGAEKLSSYHFFEGDLKNLQPAEDIIGYSLNSALFSDYAFKKRFVKIPKGKKASYHATEVLNFPEGTVLIKNFYYPADFRKPEEQKRILETRLLILENGNWKALPYIWNDEQTEAYLEVAGKNIEVEWIHLNGEKRKVNYSVPNVNQCKGCHLRGDQLSPIGPSARQLNSHDAATNQLLAWQRANVLEGLPDLKNIPLLASYENKNEPIDNRARAWLEINCAHCHRADGPAKTSGLHLLASVNASTQLGIGKAPVAAGKGSGGRLFGIVPGKPEESILQYRIESTHPGIMMPELGRKLVHEEGVELVRQWISEMK